MQNEHHNLALEFPEFKDKIHELKTSNNHFRRLMDEHHELDKQVRRVEAQEEVMTDEALENLKKKRLQLKDECYQILTAE
jgi:uncharacterized protein YdcH (DUF465 family)